MGIINIALLQMYSCGLNQELNIEKAEYYIRLAKQMKADLVLFPELWTIGHLPLNEFSRMDKDWKAYAMSQHSAYIVHFCKLAKALNIGIGLTYLSNRNNAPYNAFILISLDGEPIYLLEKPMLDKKNDLKKRATFTLQVRNEIITGGVLIGSEFTSPEAMLHLRKQGAELILIPYAHYLNPLELSVLKVRAFEHQMAIALCNYAGISTGQSIAYHGIAYNWQGKLIDMELIRSRKEEGVFIAQIDLDDLRHYRKSREPLKDDDYNDAL